jgi:hypothetical protein
VEVVEVAQEPLVLVVEEGQEVLYHPFILQQQLQLLFLKHIPGILDIL